MLKKLEEALKKLPDNYSIDDPKFFFKRALEDTIRCTKYSHGSDYLSYARVQENFSLSSTDTTCYTWEHSAGYRQVVEVLTK